MPATENEIKEKYLERAIRELNQLNRDLQGCDACLTTKVMPVLGSGHPQADMMLVKFAPTTAEVEEGVAFYGRAGNALMKSFKRLNIDPTVIYGTVCAKCPVED
ncbi:MAG TPA: uracil-DNA glycosylase, partial [Solirubrobacterales bacterium]|nr:uracil-DNA glycosylase [Solirubrobacterales bacterium]